MPNFAIFAGPKRILKNFNKMKTIKIIAAALVALSVAACNSPKTVKVNDQVFQMPSSKLTDSVSYFMGLNFGSMLKQDNFGQLNFAQVEKGVNDFLKAKGTVQDENFFDQFKLDVNTMNEVINRYLNMTNEYANALASVEESKLLAEVEKDGMTKTESGLLYKVLATGNGVKPTSPTDTVLVHYKGTLPDGSVFDETPSDGDPIRFALNQVIPGWTEGLQYVEEGGKIKLVIPSEIGYGSRGSGPIPGNTPLTFEVELHKVFPAAPVVEE